MSEHRDRIDHCESSLELLNWHESWHERPLRTRKAPQTRGHRHQYRQRDSNPCYRRERAAS
jgi:hypothetical protein